MKEENKLFSATQTFFKAPRSSHHRRASSAEPGLSSNPGEDEFIDRRRASTPSLIHSLGPTHLFHLFDPPRGRERTHGRLSVDEAILERAHPQENHSRSPTAARNSPSHAPSQEDASMLPAYEAPSRSPLHPSANGSEAIVLGSDEQRDAGDGWQEFKKGTALILTLQ
jgi:hypothetical protein